VEAPRAELGFGPLRDGLGVVIGRIDDVIRQSGQILADYHVVSQPTQVGATK
jgi:hypothetical protein